MDLFNHAELRTLREERPGPHVSIYIPTHPGGSEENVIRWRKCVAEAQERVVDEGLREPDVKRFLAPARALLEDPALWRHTREGLAWFQAPEFTRLYRLPWSFTQAVDCGPSFLVKPLLPLLVGDGRFFVLALSQKGVRLLQGSREAVSAIDLTRVKGVPVDLADTLKYDEKFEPLTFHTRRTSSGGWGAIFSGHGVGIDDHKDDLLRYFQEINKGLHAILKEEQAPLVLASVEFLWPLYRRANSYPHLVEEGIGGNPDHVSDRELHDRAWKLIEPHFARRTEAALSTYARLANTERTTHRLEELVPAVCQGRIETLFVASDREIWGGYDPNSGQLWIHDKRQPPDDDLLNFTTIEALGHRRMAYALPAERMPGGAVAAGIYCLPLAKHPGKRP